MRRENKSAIEYLEKLKRTSGAAGPSTTARANGKEIINLEGTKFARNRGARSLRHDEKSRRGSNSNPEHGAPRHQITGNIELSDDDRDVVALDIPIGGAGKVDLGNDVMASSATGPSSVHTRRHPRNFSATDVDRRPMQLRRGVRSRLSPEAQPTRRQPSRRLEHNPEEVRFNRRKRDAPSRLLGDGSPLNPATRASHSAPVEIKDEDEGRMKTRSRVEREKAARSTRHASPERRVTRSASNSKEDADAKEKAEVAEEVKDLDALDAPYTGPTHVIFQFPPRERGKITITAEERERLRQRKYLNDSLIDFYLKLKETELKDHPSSSKVKVKFFSSFFYGILRRGKPVDYAAVKSWTKDIDLFSTSLVFVPICDSYHWSLIIVANLNALEAVLQRPDDAPTLGGDSANQEVLTSTGTPRIIYLDSLDPKRGSEIGETIRHYLVEEWMCRKQVEEAKETRHRRVSNQFKNAIKILKPDVPVQTNEYDCGLYLMQSLKMFLRNTDGFATKMLRGKENVYSDMYTQVDVQKLRMEIINLIDLYEQAWTLDGNGEVNGEKEIALKILETTDVIESRYIPQPLDVDERESIPFERPDVHGKNYSTALHADRGDSDIAEVPKQHTNESLLDSQRPANCAEERNIQFAVQSHEIVEDVDSPERTLRDKESAKQVDQRESPDLMDGIEFRSRVADDISPANAMVSRDREDSDMDQEEQMDCGSLDSRAKQASPEYVTHGREGDSLPSVVLNERSDVLSNRGRSAYEIKDDEREEDEFHTHTHEICNDYRQVENVGAKRKRRFEDLDKVESDGSCREMHVPAMGYGGGGGDTASFENDKAIAYGRAKEFDNQDGHGSVEVQDIRMEVELSREGSPEVGRHSVPTRDLISGGEEIISNSLVPSGYGSSDDEVEEVSVDIKRP